MTHIVAVQEVWVRSTSDYNGVRHYRTRVFNETTSLSQVMEWAKAAHVMCAGQIVLSEEDVPVQHGRS